MSRLQLLRATFVYVRQVLTYEQEAFDNAMELYCSWFCLPTP